MIFVCNSLDDFGEGRGSRLIRGRGHFDIEKGHGILAIGID
jgi:hypothetical protein